MVRATLAFVRISFCKSAFQWRSGPRICRFPVRCGVRSGAIPCRTWGSTQPGGEGDVAACPESVHGQTPSRAGQVFPPTRRPLNRRSAVGGGVLLLYRGLGCRLRPCFCALCAIGRNCRMRGRVPCSRRNLRSRSRPMCPPRLSPAGFPRAVPGGTTGRPFRPYWPGVHLVFGGRADARRVMKVEHAFRDEFGRDHEARRGLLHLLYRGGAGGGAGAPGGGTP
jgi:hypothetical protein